MKKIFACLLIIGILIGCGHRVPKPETVVVHATPKETNEKINFTVHGNDIKFDLFLPSFTFNPETTGKDIIKVILYIDGEKVGEFQSAAFIIKNVQSGKRDVKIDIMNITTNSLYLSRTLEVSVK